MFSGFNGKRNKPFYYMTSSVSGQDEQIARSDWLPERARWSDTARSGFFAWSRKIKDHFLVF